MMKEPNRCSQKHVTQCRSALFIRRSNNLVNKNNIDDLYSFTTVRIVKGAVKIKHDSSSLTVTQQVPLPVNKHVNNRLLVARS